MKKDAEKETLQRIVEAATAEFAEVGYAGARVDAIAKRAGVNKAAIYYHIGGKREVYEYVLNTLSSTVVDRVIPDVQQVPSPEEQLRRYIHNLAQAFDQNPSLAPIILREMAVRGEHLSERFFQTLFRLIATLTKILAEGEQQGVFVPTIPLVIHFMTIGPLVLSKIRGILLSENTCLSEILQLAEGQFSSSMLQNSPELYAMLKKGLVDNPEYNIVEEIETLILKAVKCEK